MWHNDWAVHTLYYIQLPAEMVRWHLTSLTVNPYWKWTSMRNKSIARLRNRKWWRKYPEIFNNSISTVCGFELAKFKHWNHDQSSRMTFDRIVHDCREFLLVVCSRVELSDKDSCRNFLKEKSHSKRTACRSHTILSLTEVLLLAFAENRKGISVFL